jgi:hypothetical protein
LRHENSLQHLANVLRSTRPRSGAGPPSSKYTRSRSVRKEKEGHDFEAALSLFFPVGLIAERAGLPFALSSSISPPPPTADARVSARSKPDCGGDVSGDGSRIRPRADRSLQPAFRQRIYPAAAREQAPVRVRVRQPGHGPGCSVAKPSRTHSFTALVNHTAQAPPPRQSALVVRCRPRNSSPAMRLRLPVVRREVHGGPQLRPDLCMCR